MSDVGDMYKLQHDIAKDKRAKNRRSSTDILLAKGISCDVKNDGAHLIVTGLDGLIDFWPSSGKFITRRGKSGRGVFNLIKLCAAKEIQP